MLYFIIFILYSQCLLLFIRIKVVIVLILDKGKIMIAKRINRIITLFIILLFSFCCVFCTGLKLQSVNAMPFYNLKPQDIVKRASFSTKYSSSSEARKQNVKLKLFPRKHFINRFFVGNYCNFINAF